MKKKIVVFGSTGLVGLAVAAALRRDFDVVAVTRDANGPKAKSLADLGCTVTCADQNKSQALLSVLEGAYGCFVHTSTDQREYDRVEQHGHNESPEIQRGKNIADACKRAGVQHVVFSTKLSVVKVFGVSARHMDNKAEIETYMARDVKLPLTPVIIPCLYEHFLIPPMRPKPEQGCYGLDIPMGHTPLDIIAVQDVGEVVSHVFNNRERWLHKTFSMSGDKLTIRDIAAYMTRYLAPKVVRDRQITVEKFRRQDFVEADDFANMFDFFGRVDQRASVDFTKKANPNTQTFDEWLSYRPNASALDSALSSA